MRERAIYDEYEDVLRRPRLKLNEATISETLVAIRDQGRWILSPSPVTACPDPDDDIFVACAAAAKANYIVTGNLKDFPSVWESTTIVAPRQFLEIEFSDRYRGVSGTASVPLTRHR